jgi:hypothetical protein
MIWQGLTVAERDSLAGPRWVALKRAGFIAVKAVESVNGRNVAFIGSLSSPPMICAPSLQHGLARAGVA